MKYNALASIIQSPFNVARERRLEFNNSEVGYPSLLIPPLGYIYHTFYSMLTLL